jgi:hypothetical protein
MTFGVSTKTFPFVDLANQCPISETVAPTTAPVPHPIICFSGGNLVEVQEVGHILIHLLCIGDL